MTNTTRQSRQQLRSDILENHGNVTLAIHMITGNKTQCHDNMK